jgi:hypothetical protein
MLQCHNANNYQSYSVTVLLPHKILHCLKDHRVLLVCEGGEIGFGVAGCEMLTQKNK